MEGESVTPVGISDALSSTVPAKLPTGVYEIPRVSDAPGASSNAAGFTFSVKSAAVEEPPPTPSVLLPPLPQPQSGSNANRNIPAAILALDISRDRPQSLAPEIYILSYSQSSYF